MPEVNSTRYRDLTFIILKGFSLNVYIRKICCLNKSCQDINSFKDVFNDSYVLIPFERKMFNYRA